MKKKTKQKNSDKKIVLLPADAWRNRLNLPNKKTSCLDYSLDANHNLNITFTQIARFNKYETLSFSSNITNITSDSITFKILARNRYGRKTYKTIRLAGRWQADTHNRLSFHIKKNEGSEGSLIFRGGWNANKNNSITYTYKTTDLKTKRVKTKSLLFEGYWEMPSSDRLVYILDIGRNSYFSFRAQMQSPNVVPKRGVIKYRIGIGTEGKYQKNKTISLFGEWKFGDKAAASFVINYGKGHIKEIKFKSDFKISKNGRVICELSGKNTGKPAFKIGLNKKFLKNNASAFILASRQEYEKRIEAGAKIRF